MIELFPDPGIIPSRPAPMPGESIHLSLGGFPPHKDTHFSIRNPRHRYYQRFAVLRQAAIQAMDGRKWFDGPVQLDLDLYAPMLPFTLSEFLGGVMDTLDGSHGYEFTYLPIVYQDDCQVCSSTQEHLDASAPRYVVSLKFLADRSSNPGGQ